ncbi:MAG: 2-hydroxyacyl-CoA dehydratase [Lachnospiraceae bacterium]|nr:2-hydroxyacyl-CoA dehydratase [Lachnospiraceae bacterium]
MRDLKHIIEFEELLQEANNDLVRQAKAEGLRALGYTCYYMPEVLLDLPGCFSVRLRAPRSTSPDMATYYMSNRTCMYGRCLLERALEGGFNFLDAEMATETCTVTCRFQEHLQMMDIIQNPDFFCEFTDVPFKKTPNSLEHFKKQLIGHVLKPLEEHFGIDISDDAMRKAIEQHNEVCRLINEIGAYRKRENPVITGWEFQLIQLVSLTCPKYLIIDKLRDIAEDLKTREPDEKPRWRCRVVLAGSENDDPDFTKLIEDCGALVVADRHCYGSLPGREEIVIRDGETPLDAITRHYLETSECPRFMEQHIMRERKRKLADTVKEYKADGLIIAQMKFCEYWSYERTIDTIILPRDYGIPVCSIEKEYVNNAVGQLRTRFQAFIESIEIKKIAQQRDPEAGGEA